MKTQLARQLIMLGLGIDIGRQVTGDVSRDLTLVSAVVAMLLIAATLVGPR